MVASCVNREFFLAQSDVLRKCIEEHKWYLSEKACRDVGWQFAEENFFKTYFAGFAVGYRASYCGLVCPFRMGCVSGQKYLTHVHEVRAA